LRARGHDAVAGLRTKTEVEGASHNAVQVDFAEDIGPEGPFDAIFLLRPPQIADPAPFAKFLSRFSTDTRVVFLSVQGADRQSYLPHAKIERVITAAGFPHVFVRPGYFMDNLVTTLLPELLRNRRIYLPAGQLALDWVSARDVAAVCVAALTGGVPCPAITVTGGARLGFDAACDQINATLGTKIRYENARLIAFIAHSRRTGTAWSFILVMLLLHFVPRWGRQPPPPPVDWPVWIGRAPDTVADFARRNSDTFNKLK